MNEREIKIFVGSEGGSSAAIHAGIWQKLSSSSDLHHNPRELRNYKESGGRSASPATSSLRGFAVINNANAETLSLNNAGATNSMERRPASSVEAFMVGASSHGILPGPCSKDVSRWSSRLATHFFATFKIKLKISIPLNQFLL
uniref:Uncharacterized protein n=1 Tax=Panagrolaimus sp. PS1159 TaxID=55785 RepID=A0AC35EXH4_9BILA